MPAGEGWAEEHQPASPGQHVGSGEESENSINMLRTHNILY